MEDRALEILLKVKDDVADTREAIGRVEGQMSRLPCSVHASEIVSLQQEVSDIRTKDLPELRQDVAILAWFRKGRNKIAAAVLMALLGLAGSVGGAILIKKFIPPDPPAAAAPAPIATPTPDAR